MADFTTYQAPGTYIEEENSPLVSVVGATPSVVAIVGPSVGYRLFNETITLNGTTPVTLAKLGVNGSSVVVAQPDGTPYALTTDYTVTAGEGEDENISTTRDNTMVIARTNGGGIVDGSSVRVSYRYTDAVYFNPTRFSDFDDVKDAYGQPLNITTGEVTSPLSMAAKFAFDNGAQNVILVATDSAATSVDRQELSDGLAKLEAVYDLSLVVPLPVGITGTDLSPGETLGVGTDLANHCESLSADNYFRIGLVGYETTVTVDPVTLSDAINSDRVINCAPYQWNWYNSTGLGQTQIIGGYYMAAALAGQLVSGRVQDGLTKRRVSGFSGIPAAVFQTMTKSLKDTWSAGGVAVVELTRQNTLVCRHGTSTNVSSMLTREISLTRCRDTMMRVMQDTVDASQLIGSAIDELTPTRVKGVVAGVLETMKGSGVILDYNSLKARQRPTSPDVIEVKFQYRPSYPLNYILISFSIDTTTGTTTVGTATS